MRRVRIGALIVTAGLVCVLAERVLTVDPPHPKKNAILESKPGGSSGVPAPPPLPGVKTPARPKKQMEPQGIAAAQPEAPQVSPSVEAEPLPVIVVGNGEPATGTVDAAAPATVETASEQKGPIIVVPHERPKEDSRGARWMKAVGHALGIGQKDPAEQSLR